MAHYLRHLITSKIPIQNYTNFLLQSIFNQLDQLQSDYVGLFSLKFSKKSLLEAKDVMSHIQNNPGYDVYLFNPYPQEDFMFYNIWDHGEFSHPGIKNNPVCLK